MTLRDELARVLPGSDYWARRYADDVLLLLRSRIPGFDALVEGEAVVASKHEATKLMSMAEDLRDLSCAPDYRYRCEIGAAIRAMLAASPYAQRESGGGG